ncbi:MFS general substrate transporter [Cryphonectria parasitica EP155]|uniref:MFS general substrate transporter n=1 Tax=Cryphonectria parasitica (strain ATCC 38755 / EP155) TaxID=660469 RepID=A0A9P5CT29_CRYP1|nr:MFS general substrate transporter [Cryphonectria parasitica EP155]KAF3768981.1 MFS general substrate transporter [Cryphonectria parasitica EP155]
MDESQKPKTVQREVAEEDIVTGKKNSKGIILRPQPSNDPNEPLNWSQWDKYTTYLVICWFTFLAFMNSSAFTVAVQAIIKQFKKSSTEASYLTSLQVLFMGFGALVWMPLIRIIGKRPGYLASLVFLCVTNVWGFYSTTYGSLLASRIVGGFLTAAADAPVPSVVAELFFFHERGHGMMFFSLALSCGAFLGPLFNAYITQYLGWKWMCGVMAIVSGATFFVALFLLKETAYVVGPEGRDLEAPASAYAPRRSWLASLGFTIGYNQHASFFGWVARTVLLVAYPPVLIAGLICGLFIGCNIAVQLVASQTFTAAPWNWTLHSVGLLAISGFIGSLLSFFAGGRLIDLIATRMTARRSEHPEPEFRLPAMIIPAVVGPMGMLLYGLVIAAQDSWGGAAVGYGMEGFGATAAANIIITYAVDAYRPIAGETIVIVFIVRNVIGCLISTYISVWIKQQGVRHAFGELVGVAYIILSLSLVLFVFGRRIRAFTGRFGPMASVAFH